MSDSPRLISILVNAAGPADPRGIDGLSKTEFDTSCPHVPLGFVRVWRMRLPPDETPDQFWSYCLVSDEHLNVLSASVKELDSSRLRALFETIQSDLARVGEVCIFAWLSEVKECLTVDAACDCCCGKVLLVRCHQEAIYAHWHRES
jgi:hypothetical protein